MKSFLKIISLLVLIGGALPAPAQVAARAIQIVLVKIDSYAEYKEIQETVQKTEGVYELTPRTETPGLITLDVEYAGDSQQLTELLEQSLGKKYTISRRTLPTGISEINISKG